jgi:iron complex outermembrane receptor protein
MNKPIRLASAIASILLVQGGLAAGNIAHAQDDTAMLGEITVTAQKREQSLQDVGISIAAFSGEQMKQLGVTDTTEITQQIPGLQLNAWSPMLTVFNLRGVSQNNFTDNLEAPVAVYIDDAYVSSMNAISGQMFDMKRVEVLRGPQGTLFGRNATGGLIHFISRGAEEQETNGYIEVGGASYNRKNVEAAIGGSLGERVRGRLAGRWEKSDGYIKAQIPGARDIGGVDGYALRGALQFDATDNLKIDLLYKFSKDSDVPTGGYIFMPYADQEAGYVPTEWIDLICGCSSAALSPTDFASFRSLTAGIFFNPVDGFAPSNAAGLTLFRGDSPEPYKHFSDYKGYMNREIHNGTVKFDWKAGPVDVVSITNFMKLDKFYTEDGDGVPAKIIEFTTVNDMKQWSQELRFSGQTDRFRWQTGGYYMNIKMDAGAKTVGAPVFGIAADLVAQGIITPDQIGSAPAIDQNYVLESKNWSLFGQAEYDLTEQFTLIAGLRYSSDKKTLLFDAVYSDDETGVGPIPQFNLQQAIAAAGGGDQDTVDYKDYAARLQLDYKLNSDVLLFAAYNRGIKGGNFSPSANVTLTNVRHENEVLHSFELGAKTTFWGGRARLNATAFYYDYKDYQVFALVGGFPQVGNADAKIKGGEIELFLKPSANWDLSFGLSILDSKIGRVPVAGTQVPPAGLPVIDWPEDYVFDTKMPNAPKYSFNYLVRYNFDEAVGNLALQADGVIYAQQYLEATNGGTSYQGGYGVHNARLIFTSADDHWQLSAWCKNVLDKAYKTYALDLGILGGTAYYAPPRTYGASLAYRF